MHDPKVEQFLTKKRYTWRYVEALSFDDISHDANPARWTVEVDQDRAIAIGIDIEAGMKMPAIVCCETKTSLVALLSGRHRIEGSLLAKQNQIAAYIIEDVLDEFEMAELPIALNCKEGRVPTHGERLDQAAVLTLQFPDRARKVIAQDLGLKVREIEAHLQLVKALERAEEHGVVSEMRKLRDDHLRVAVNTLRLTKVFRHAVQTLAFTGMVGRAAKGLIKDLEAAHSETDALAILDRVDEEHRDEIDRRRRQGRRVRSKTVAQRWRSSVKAAVGLYPETIELLELGSHGPEFVIDTEELAKDMRAQCNAVIEKCADLRAHWDKKHPPLSPKDGEVPSDRPSSSA